MADIHGVPSEADMVPVRPGEMSGPLEDLSAMTAAAESLANGPRQAQAETLLTSPQGFGIDGYDIDAGYSGGGGEDWPNNVEPAGM
jgi:hypothetical protein